MKRVKARKDADSGQSAAASKNGSGTGELHGHQGHARFESSRTVAVNDEVLQADRIYINVGGRASVP